MLDVGSDLATPTIRQNGTVTLIVLPIPSLGDSNEPVSSVAEVIVASGGAILAKSPQLMAIAGTAKAVEPANHSASKAKRGNMRCMISPPVSPTKSHNSKADC
jgi:hypothetical protein